MQIFKKPGVLFCLSAILFVLGTFLVTLEVPVRITYDPTAAEQYDFMRAYLPLGFALWILALVFLVGGIVLGVRKPLAVAPDENHISMVSIIVGLLLGFLALTSTFLPWVIAERTEPLIEIRGGIINVGQYHVLTGIDLMMGTNSMVGDVILFVFVGAIISILHIPLLTFIEKEKVDAMRAFLFLLSGICIISPVALVYAQRIWWISLDVNGALGSSVTFKSLGIGLLIASSCAIGLIASGIVTTIKLAQQHMYER